jgi:putative transposase
MSRTSLLLPTTIDAIPIGCDGAMTEALETPLTIPPELGSAAEMRSELRERVRAVEEDHAAERLRTGHRVLGRRAVLARSWRGQPFSCEPRRNLRPRVASRSKWVRLEALKLAAVPIQLTS